MRCENFLKVHKNTVEKMFAKYLSADGCFVETIIPLTVMWKMMLSVSWYLGVFFYYVAHETKFYLKY